MPEKFITFYHKEDKDAVEHLIEVMGMLPIEDLTDACKKVEDLIVEYCEEVGYSNG